MEKDLELQLSNRAHLSIKQLELFKEKLHKSRLSKSTFSGRLFSMYGFFLGIITPIAINLNLFKDSINPELKLIVYPVSFLLILISTFYFQRFSQIKSIVKYKSEEIDFLIEKGMYLKTQSEIFEDSKPEFK